MSKKIDRTGERNINNFGSEIIIVEYKNRKDIDVYFPEYDWITRNVQYDNFKRGGVKCPYDRSIYSVGYIGEGKYKAKENGKITKCYHTWYNMLMRCYDSKYHKKEPTYISCETSEEFLNFQNFGEWYEENYYEIEGKRMHLDKDILVKHNKVYSPETCIFVPQTINSLFVKNNKNRGESVTGTSFTKDNKYMVNCWLFNPETGKSKGEYLGTYDTQEKAFEVYKYYKEKNIKQVADYYKDLIPQKLYDAMYDYEVEITD